MTLPKSSLFLAAVLFSFSLHGQTRQAFEDRLVDYVSWTAEIAGFVTREDAPEKPRRLLLGGNVSPTAQAQIEKAGWETASSSGQ